MGFKAKFSSLIELLRPELAAAAGVCVLLGEIIALGRVSPAGQLLLGFACGFCASAAALVLNDVFDIETDRVNAPQRAIPSGRVSSGEAVALFALVSLVALGTALAVSPLTLLLATLLWAVGILYNWRFKKAGLLGNLMVATSVASTFVLGGLIVGQPGNGVIWVFAAIAFFIDLGEEIAGDALDMQGDQLAGSRSIALVAGRQTAMRLSAAAHIVAVALTLAPFAAGWMGPTYLALIVLMDAGVLYFAYRLHTARDLAAARGYLRAIYLAATVGLLAFLVERLLT